MVDDHKVLPASLKGLGQVHVDLEWTYGVGNSTAISTNSTELEESSLNLNADVTFDMFFDPDSTTAQDPNKATTEVMVWLAKFGPVALPLGHANGTIASYNIGNVTL